MYTYIPTLSSFRLSTWPYGGDHYVYTYQSGRYWFDIKAILDYLEAQLLKTPVAFVLKSTFSLINVYSAYQENSIGLSVEPSRNVMRGPIVFTFARTRVDQAHQAEAVSWPTSKTATWGLNHSRPVDFISISLSIDLCARTGLNRVLKRDLRLVHDIVGAWTKAVVMQREPMGTQNADVIKAKLLHWNIPKATWEVAISDWQYCLDFWKRMPELLRISWTPTFVEYYCRFIAPNLPQYQESPLYAQYFEEAKDRITNFILRHMQGQVLPEEQNLLQFLPIMDVYTDVETLATNIAKGISE